MRTKNEATKLDLIVEELIKKGENLSEEDFIEYVMNNIPLTLTFFSRDIRSVIRHFLYLNKK